MDVGAHDGRAKGHRLHHDAWEGFFEAGADEKIGGDKEVKNVTRFRYERNIRQAEPGEIAFEQIEINARAGPDHNKAKFPRSAVVVVEVINGA